MKVRLTVILENDKPVPILDGVDKEMLEQVMQRQYQEAFNRLVSLGTDPTETATVKQCELIKEV